MAEKYQRIDVTSKGLVTFEAEAPCLVHAGGGAVFSGKTASSMVFLRKGDRISAKGPGYINVVRPGAAQQVATAQKNAASNEFTAMVLSGLKNRIQATMSENHNNVDGMLVSLTLLEVDIDRSIKALLSGIQS